MRLRPALALTAAFLASCRAQDRPVRLAVAVPLTGDSGTEGLGVLRAVQLAVEEANAAGKLPFRLEVRALDDRADAREAVNVANLIVTDSRVAAVIGHYNSGCALAAAPIYARASLAMLVPSATHPDVTRRQLDPGWPGPRNVFRLCPTDDVQSARTAEFVRLTLGLKRLAVIHDSTPYGRGLAERVRDAFAARGGQIAAFEAASVGQKDFAPLVQRLRAARAAGVFFGGFYTEAGLLARELRRQGVSTPFISGDGSRTRSLFAVAGGAADGAYVSSIGVPVELLPGAAGFIESYRRRYTQPHEEMKPYDHFAYEAARILVDALAQVGPDKARLIETARATDRDGLLGRVRFDHKGDNLNQVVTITRADWKTRSFVPAP